MTGLVDLRFGPSYERSITTEIKYLPILCFAERLPDRVVFALRILHRRRGVGVASRGEFDPLRFGLKCYNIGYSRV